MAVRYGKPALKAGLDAPLSASARLALHRKFREGERQKWREARRKLLSHLPQDAVWHVAFVAVGKGARAERRLQEAGFWSYSPIERVTTGRGAHRQDVERALFPRYVFFARRRADADIRQVREVLDVLGGIAGDWISAPPALIKGLVESERLGAFDRTEGRIVASREARRAKLSTGSQVTILEGPLRGFSAEIKALKPEQRVACLVWMFGGHVDLETGIDNVEAVDSPMRRTTR